MFDNILNASISTPQVNASTCPQGPRGKGIKSIRQDLNSIIITLDDDSEYTVAFPDWWFGTIDEYNAIPIEDRTKHYLYFIRDDV